MAGRIVVTGRVPEPALELLREAGDLDAHMQETTLPQNFHRGKRIKWLK